MLFIGKFLGVLVFATAGFAGIFIASYSPIWLVERIFSIDRKKPQAKWTYGLGLSLYIFIFQLIAIATIAPLVPGNSAVQWLPFFMLCHVLGNFRRWDPKVLGATLVIYIPIKALLDLLAGSWMGLLGLVTESMVMICLILAMGMPFYWMANILYYPEPDQDNDLHQNLSSGKHRLKRTRIFGLRGFNLAFAILASTMVALFIFITITILAND